MPPLLLALIAYLLGSLPFSVWLGKLFIGQDVRRFGDQNPGATNVYRAGNKLVALLVLMLDISKAAAPVGFAYYNLGIRGLPLFIIAMAPPLGHAFSPFLGFRGGKALASVLGVWIGLTLWKASLAAILFVVIGFILFELPGWAVMLGLSGILVTLLIWLPDPLLLAVLAGQFILLIWKYRADLQRWPRFRSRHPRREGFAKVE
jgi:glycerol-3-phosphate acyltransferase PlsY